jgi:hypothetical protein
VISRWETPAKLPDNVLLLGRSGLWHGFRWLSP